MPMDYTSSMSDKEFVLSVIQRMPKSVSLAQIRERVDFLAGIKAGEESLDRGEGVPHDEVEKQFKGWIKKWRSKSPGRNRPSATSPA